MIIGRGRHREHPANIVYYYYGVAQLPVAHTQGNPERGQVTFRSSDWRHFRSKGPTRANMAQLPVAHAQNIHPDRAPDWRHFRSRDCRDFQSRHFRSRDFWLHPLTAPPQMLTELYPYTTPVIPLSNDIWYRCVAHGFTTFYFLIFYRWSIIHLFFDKCMTNVNLSEWLYVLLIGMK